jgi:hypothetical protein
MVNMQSLDYIITAKHYAAREGAKTVKERILRIRERLHKNNGIRLTIAEADKAPSGKAVRAEINFGQWIAVCECGGAEFVDPDEPLFFCFSCGNRANESRIRPVTFPPKSERELIERLVLERPVDDLRGMTDLERAHQARALIYQQVETEAGGASVALPLTRCWTPDESLQELTLQNIAITAWRESLKEPGAKGKI